MTKKKIATVSKWLSLPLLGIVCSGIASAQATAPAGPSNADLKVMVDTVWVLMTAFLVFWMNAGFGCVESGLCRAKNATNILGKNFVVFAFSTIAYWAVGSRSCSATAVPSWASADGWWQALTTAQPWLRRIMACTVP